MIKVKLNNCILGEDDKPLEVDGYGVLRCKTVKDFLLIAVTTQFQGEEIAPDNKLKLYRMSQALKKAKETISYSKEQSEMIIVRLNKFCTITTYGQMVDFLTKTEVELN